jgi:hypothetical protein
MQAQGLAHALAERCCPCCFLTVAGTHDVEYAAAAVRRIVHVHACVPALAARVMEGPAAASVHATLSGIGRLASVRSISFTRINTLSTPTASTRKGMTCRDTIDILDGINLTCHILCPCICTDLASQSWGLHAHSHGSTLRCKKPMLKLLWHQAGQNKPACMR